MDNLRHLFPDRVVALSGRYFFPVFPLLFFAVGGFFASQNEGRVGLFCKTLLIFSLLACSLSAVVRMDPLLFLARSDYVKVY